LHTSNPFDAAWSPDGARVAVGSYHSVVEVWDAVTGKLLVSLPHDDTVHNVWWHVPDALITGTHRHIRRWDTARFREQTDISLPYYASFVDVTRDSRRVAVKLLEREAEEGVLVFDLETGALVHTLGDVIARHVVFDAAGRYLVTAHRGARVWDVETGALVRSLPLTGDTDLAWPSPDGLLATVSGRPAAELWNVATGERVGLLGGHLGAATSLAFTRDGRYLATASTRSVDDTAKLWRRDDGRLIAVYPHADAVAHLAFSEDGNELATGDREGAVATWNTTTHQRLRTFAKHTCAITGLDRHADDLLSASCDGTAVLWDARTGGERTVLAAGYPLTAARFSPDGATAITAGRRDVDALVTLWDTRTGAVRTTLPAGKRCSPTIAVAPDGSSLLAACAGALRVWKLPSGTLLHELATGGADVVSASYSSDGAEILTASHDGIARRFDTESGALRASLLGDPDGFEVSAAHVGGHVVTAARYTGELMLWEGTDPLTTVDARQGEVHSVIADPFEDNRFLTIGEDIAGTLRVWRLR
ncbi:MAG: hypothetical protein H0V17_06940, partial [Deltaproteobacteria bacterium]|nr:hypothetical protein [Deltaproteobacteria bacterium]